MGNGSVDHESYTGEAALVLVFHRLEEGVACSTQRERALFGKVYFADSSHIDVQPS